MNDARRISAGVVAFNVQGKLIGLSREWPLRHPDHSRLQPRLRHHERHYPLVTATN
ncbi:hypothetical protein [Chitinimonas koreensis]|uniref:hypothetical protein n=1 Tax=Chitinimonas koreensis TaxID=356302 RepID=UPI0012F8B0EB|nr:hypothetical protein [Chitinimonas koreensis]QNM96209.1 hypothetical protein H9L41_20755 [Chitinimonas koreensis]